MDYTLSSEDIFQFLNKHNMMLKSTGKILPIDKVPIYKAQKNTFYIFNSDPTFLPGEHWMCMFIPESSPPEFFDSLGKSPWYYSKKLKDFLGPKFIYNCVRIQPTKTSTCGLYCLYFLYHRLKGVTFPDIMSTFSDYLNHNDNIVIDFYINFN